MRAPPGAPTGHWSPSRSPGVFQPGAMCPDAVKTVFHSRLKIEINGTPPSGSLLFPKRSRSITARSAMLAFGFVSVARRCIKKRGVSLDFDRDICASDSNYNTHRGWNREFSVDSPDGNETELTSRCASRAGARRHFFGGSLLGIPCHYPSFTPIRALIRSLYPYTNFTARLLSTICSTHI